jgi:hypothetical protein
MLIIVLLLTGGVVLIAGAALSGQARYLVLTAGLFVLVAAGVLQRFWPGVAADAGLAAYCLYHLARTRVRARGRHARRQS